MIHADGATLRDSRGASRAALVDPTGCGDAYRAGLLYGIAQALGLGAHRAARVDAGRAQDRARAAGRTTRSTATRSRRYTRKRSAKPFSRAHVMKLRVRIVAPSALLALGDRRWRLRAARSGRPLLPRRAAARRSRSSSASSSACARSSSRVPTPGVGTRRRRRARRLGGQLHRRQPGRQRRG